MLRPNYPVVLIALCLGALSNGKAQEASGDSLAADSLKAAHKVTQAMLQEHIKMLTRSPLGKETVEWSHVLEVKVTRGGRSNVQRFWFNPSKDGPLIWLPDTAKQNNILWYHPNRDQLASLFPTNGTGTLIPTELALKMGLTGNSTATAKKRESTWTSEQMDSLEYCTMELPASTIHITLGPKNSWQADGVNRWLSMQPIPGYTLPTSSKKRPILSLNQKRDSGSSTYAFEVLQMNELQEPQVLDLSRIQVNDPNRDLQTIAKEWKAEGTTLPPFPEPKPEQESESD